MHILAVSDSHATVFPQVPIAARNERKNASCNVWISDSPNVVYQTPVPQILHILVCLYLTSPLVTPPGTAGTS